MKHNTTALEINPPCPFVMPKNLILETEFTEFCNLKLGVSPHRVRKDIERWLEEDHGGGDPTLFAGFTQNRSMQFFIIAKQDFVLSGKQMMAEVFRYVSNGELELYSDVSEGQKVTKGTVLLGGHGKASSILLGERVALNFCAKMSGVATKTSQVIAQMAPFNTSTQLLETRKTTPGLRIYEKYSVRLGGARNHRHALDGGAMLKENHLRSIGHLDIALQNLQKNLPTLTKAEVEVTNLAEFRAALNCGADVIMLDNFSFDDVKVAVAERNLSGLNTKLELSGNLDEKNLADILQTNVDFISMGALIHKAVWVDMSLQVYRDGNR